MCKKKSVYDWMRDSHNLCRQGEKGSSKFQNSTKYATISKYRVCILNPNYFLKRNFKDWELNKETGAKNTHLLFKVRILIATIESVKVDTYYHIST